MAASTTNHLSSTLITFNMAPLSLPSSSMKSATTAAALALLTGIIIHQRKAITTTYEKVRGIEGVLRYIWIGDFLPLHIREAMEKLDCIEERMTKADAQLEEIEILIERAELESVDGPRQLPEQDFNKTDTTANDREAIKKQLFQQYPELRTKIGMFSTSLDKLAYGIDAVNSHRDADVKTRKKLLSNKIVDLMSNLDRMVLSLNIGVEL